MILLYGYADDAPLVAVGSALAELAVPYLVADQRVAGSHDLVLELDSAGIGGSVTIAGQAVPLAEVSAVYARPLTTPPQFGDARAGTRALAFGEAFLDWLDVADCLVINRPSAMHSNASKPFQAQQIGAAGFSVPDTLITSEPAEVSEFRRLHGELVFKSTSGVRSIVRRLDSRSGQLLERVRDLPTQFQQLVEGVDVRVHVLGESVFACEVASRAVDYRYAHRDGLEVELTRTELGEEVARSCIDLTARLGLAFAGIDLRRREDGEYVCFEVNPMPGYTYFEREAGLEISAALAALLARDNKPRWSRSSPTERRSKPRSSRARPIRA